ncbi:hypothetical protein [Microlunatus flavus]|uniref:Uncharacterized protein n=1 Tax=Microlunatus flavus TaxID=1036181 RepID=A0A1H9AYQ4_9ACTN|nr:hypothetical protein [Microlunatus flavus]SEP81922.1 hypothetical protein SAMN05421756_101781 [Microlunatus flavus]
MPVRRPRPLRAAGAGLLGLTLAAGLAPLASAGTPLEAFASISSVADGCRSTVITGIDGSPGVRYYAGGHRLRFPTKRLRFDTTGVVELTARGKGGASVDQPRHRLAAPEECFADAPTVDTSIPRYTPKISWCSTDKHPHLAQAFVSDDAEPVVYVLRHRTSQRLADYGATQLAEGSGETRFDLDRGLEPGRYVLEVSQVFAAPGTYGWSTPVEELRCVGKPKVGRGKVTFRVPKHGPTALLSISVPSEVDPVEAVRVRAGHTYTFRTSEPEVSWVATPTGDHVGEMGHGTVDVP